MWGHVQCWEWGMHGVFDILVVVKKELAFHYIQSEQWAAWWWSQACDPDSWFITWPLVNNFLLLKRNPKFNFTSSLPLALSVSHCLTFSLHAVFHWCCFWQGYPVASGPLIPYSSLFVVGLKTGRISECKVNITCPAFNSPLNSVSVSSEEYKSVQKVFKNPAWVLQLLHFLVGYPQF